MVKQLRKKIYLIGIKGTGMSSLAVLLKNMGHSVSGSDTAEKFFTESQLKSNGIKYYEAFDPRHLTSDKPEMIVYSTAYTDTNIEISYARKNKLLVLSYPEAIGWISQKLNSVAVCGSHGKTTTTSMLAHIMESTKKSSALIGTASELNRTAKKPKYFIFEADEYQNKLRYYSPGNVILTNVDFDHPDFFKNTVQYNKAFKDFMTRILQQNGFIIYNHDNTVARKILGRAKNTASYGFDSSSLHRIHDISTSEDTFTLYIGKNRTLEIKLAVHGRHNILNATGAALMALRLGVPSKTVAERLNTFSGAKRRMEVVPSKRYLIIDDYGHHPTEIQATLSALRTKYPKKKIVAVFHPHTFTRTKTLLEDFGRSFKDADLVIVLDIYASAREEQGTIHSKDVVREINKQGSKAIYIATIPETAEYIKRNIEKDSLILTIGAGDVWKLDNLIK